MIQSQDSLSDDSVPTIEEYKSRTPHAQRISGGRKYARFVPSQTDSQRPLVSVITPVLNAANSLAQTVCSVLGQSYPNIEYIVIDGASTDGTLDILRSFDHGIDLWLSEPDAGISDAFNKGVALATGDIIGILNADDWYEPEAVAIIVDAFSSGEVDLVCGALQYWQNGRRGLIFYSDHGNLHLESTVNHPTVFVKRPIYLQHGLFSMQYRYAMDYDLLLRFFLRGVRFLVLPDVLANMRLGGASDADVLPVSRELAIIKTTHMGRPLRHGLYSAYHFMRTTLSKWLRARGCDRLLSAYRRRCSVVKKSVRHLP